MELHQKRTIACANTRWRSPFSTGYLCDVLRKCWLASMSASVLLVYRAGRTLVHQPGWTGAGTSLMTQPVRTSRLELLRTQAMKAQGMSFGEAAARRGEGRELVGTAKTVADRMQEIFEAG